MRLVLAVGAASATIAATGLVGWTAGRRAVSVAPSPPSPAAPSTVQVQSGELVVVQPMTVRVSWTVRHETRALAAAVVTRVQIPVDTAVEVHQGDVLYSLDERPAVVMLGQVPAYRDLGPGSAGWDVVQLQLFLKDAGLLASEVDGVWATSTTSAVRRWQESLGVSPSGALPLGSIAFFDSLPQLVAASSSLRVGSVVTADDVLVSSIEPLPSATLIVPGSVRGDLREATFDVDIGASTAAFRLGGTQRTDSATGETTAMLALIDSVDACPAWCMAIPFGEPVSVAATATFGNPATGAIVPIGVIQTDGSSAFVVTADGKQQSITIVLQVDGQAVVEGISVGTALVVPSGAS